MFNYNKSGSADPLEKTNSEIILPEVIAHARNLGRNNIPRISDRDIEPYISTMRSRYKDLSAQYVAKPVGNAGTLEAMEKANANKRTATLQARLKKLHEKEDELSLQAGDYGAVPLNVSTWWIHALIVAVGVFDSTITRSCLGIVESSSNLIQVIIFLVLSAIFIAVPHGVVWVFHATKNSRYRYVVWGLCCLVLLIGIGGFTFLRQRYLENVGAVNLDMQATATISVPAPILFCIQFFSLAIGVLLAFQLPSHDDKQKRHTTEAFHKNLAEVQQQIRSTEAELQRVQEGLYQNELTRTNAASQAAAMEMRIENMFQAAAGVFKANNLNARTDNEIPKCFQQPVQPLQ